MSPIHKNTSFDPSCVYVCRVYFRISLKRERTHCGKFQEGANPNPKGGGGNYILNIGKANCQGEGGWSKSIPRRGESTPSPLPPEINPALYVPIADPLPEAEQKGESHTNHSPHSP